MAFSKRRDELFVEIDGRSFHKERNAIMLKQRIDDIRLKRDEDVLIATYARTGTTWLSQIVSLMLASDDAYDAVKMTPLHDRVFFLEMTFPGNDLAQIEKLSTVPPPRADKTHLQYRFVRRWLEEDRVRTIVTTRNPKDTLVSHFHFYQNLKHVAYQGSWDEFFEQLVKHGKLAGGTQVGWLQDWDNNKDKGDILFIKYEDMKQDIAVVIRKITAFLKLEISEVRIQKIIEDANIKSMKADEAVMKEPNIKEGGNFVRSGQSGEWKKYFTAEQNGWFDNKFKSLFENLGIEVDYE